MPYNDDDDDYLPPTWLMITKLVIAAAVVGTYLWLVLRGLDVLFEVFFKGVW